jgi:hypothetical protein
VKLETAIRSLGITSKWLDCPDCRRSLMTRMGVGLIALGMVIQIPRTSVHVKGYMMPAPTAMHGLRAVFHGAGVV